MTAVVRITDAESQVMEALWNSGPISADEIVEQVAPRQAWGPATVKTLINRLLKKKALRSERLENRHVYRALVSRDDYIQTESQGLLDRLFDGQLAPLVTHFAERRALKPEEVAKLKRMIEALDAESD